MDSRLGLYNGIRLERLARPQLPELALAILAFQRKQCTVSNQFVGNIAFYEILSFDGRINIRVRADDWEKILPYLENGRWNPLIVPTAQVGWLHPNRVHDISLLPVTDRELYFRILDDLEAEFPISYPTSKL